MVNEKAVFCFNEARKPLPYSEDLNAIVVMDRDGSRLTLHDVVAERIPPLAELLKHIARPIDEVVFCFTPDRFSAESVPVPGLFEHDGPSYLMVRGPFAAEGHAFSVPRSART